MATIIDPADLDPRQRYRLMTSLVVPRPIAWISTRSIDGRRNLAPFSYFNALSSSPMLLGVSIGRRRDVEKDTLTNILQTGVFVVNLVGEQHLEPMVRSSGEWAEDVDEFQDAGVAAGQASKVDAPTVADAAAAFECSLFREVDLGASASTLVIGEVVAVRLGEDLLYDAGQYHVDVGSLRPVGRLGRDEYTLTGPVRHVPRPPRP